MERSELIKLVSQLLDPDDSISGDDLDRMLEQFLEATLHPGGSGLIDEPENWGLSLNASADEVVDAALNWGPRVVVMSIVRSGRHPNRDDLACYTLDINGKMRTQVVSSEQYKNGDRCVVALSGTTLPDGTEVRRGFVSRAFSAGEIVGLSEEPVGTELPITEIA